MLSAIREVVETAVATATIGIQKANLDAAKQCQKAIHAAEFAVAEARNTAERASRIEVILTESTNERRELYVDMKVLKERVGDLHREVVVGNAGTSLREQVGQQGVALARIEEQHAVCNVRKKRRLIFWGGVIAACITDGGGVVAACLAFF